MVQKAKKRTHCYLPAKVRIEDNSIEGTITDISRKGCQLLVKTSKITNCSTQLLEVDNEIGVIFQLPEVAKLSITGKQKNIRKDKDNVYIGILFSDLSIEEQEILYGFLSTTEA